MPISPVVEIRGLAVHCREVLVRFAARLRELKHVNQTLESQAKKLRKSKAYWEHMACHDPLTGLRNRLYFADALDRLIMEQYGSRMSVGVIFMDLDDFKFINDCYGHAAGDELLKQVAERLRQAVNKGSICRLGGDEFVVLVPSTDPAELERLSQQIVSALQRPFPVHSQSCT